MNKMDVYQEPFSIKFLHFCVVHIRGQMLSHATSYRYRSQKSILCYINRLQVQAQRLHVKLAYSAIYIYASNITPSPPGPRVWGWGQGVQSEFLLIFFMEINWGNKN